MGIDISRGHHHRTAKTAARSMAASSHPATRPPPVAPLLQHAHARGMRSCCVRSIPPAALSLSSSLSQCDSEAERPLSLSFFQLFLSVSVGLFRVCLTCNQSLCCFLCTCLLSDALEARQALAVHAVVSFFLLCVCVVSLFACVFVCLGVRCFSAEGCVCTRVRYV